MPDTAPPPAAVPELHRSFRQPWPDLDGKTILITGGTGSFGKAFARRVLAEFKLHKLIIYSRDELKQYELDQEIGHHACVRFFIGDVRDVDRLELALRETDVVIHAAALKHVPTAEYNPLECIHTNVNGAENVVKACIRKGVRHVVALSTDKAANPINLYGASKLASDKIFIAGNQLSGRNGPRFSAVRYGNVIGSRGSVVPLFRKLVAEGATSLPITDARMSRFWITLEQGVSFVLSSLALMQGGEIFVPRIPSMKVVELANAVAPDLPTREIGIRPGEKLHELMITEDDSRSTVALADRYVICPFFYPALRQRYLEQGATPVAEGFGYASHTNDEWLTIEQARALLALTG